MKSSISKTLLSFSALLLMGAGLTNPLGNITVGQLIGNVIRAALGISGSIALLMVVWGGFLWMTSSGNSERVEKGKNTLMWAALGLLIIFGSYIIVNAILVALQSGTAPAA